MLNGVNQLNDRDLSRLKPASMADGGATGATAFVLVCIAAFVFFVSYDVSWLTLYWKIFLTLSVSSFVAFLIVHFVSKRKQRRATELRLVQHEARTMEKLKQLEEFKRKEGADK